MVEFQDIQAAYYMVAATGVLIAAAYYILNLRVSMRNQELSLKALEQSAKTQELSLKAQEQNLETRQAQLFMQLFDRFSGEELSRYYGKIRYEISPLCHDSPEEFAQFVKQHEHEKFNPEFWAPIHQMSMFYEGVAVLVRKNLIDIDMVESLLADRLVWYWNLVKIAMRDDRTYQGPQLFANFEWLNDEMLRRKQKAAA